MSICQVLWDRDTLSLRLPDDGENRLLESSKLVFCTQHVHFMPRCCINNVSSSCVIFYVVIRWEDCVKKALRKAEEKENWIEKANNRDQWEKITKVACRTAE